MKQMQQLFGIVLALGVLSYGFVSLTYFHNYTPPPPRIFYQPDLPNAELPDELLSYNIELFIDPQSGQQNYRIGSTLTNLALKDADKAFNEYADTNSYTIGDNKIVELIYANTDKGDDLMQFLENRNEGITTIQHTVSPYYPPYTRFFFEVEKSTIDSFYSTCTGSCKIKDEIKRDLKFQVSTDSLQKIVIPEFQN